MLKTFLVWGFVLFPLAVAVGWIVYRARYFILGVIAITIGVAAIWGVLRLADDLWPAGEPVAETPAQPIIHGPTMQGRATSGPVPFGPAAPVRAL